MKTTNAMKLTKFPRPGPLARWASLCVVGLVAGCNVIPPPQDDPTRRRPNIELAFKHLSWAPRVGILEGLKRTIEWFAGRPDEVKHAAAQLRGGQMGENTSVERTSVERTADREYAKPAA